MVTMYINLHYKNYMNIKEKIRNIKESRFTLPERDLIIIFNDMVSCFDSDIETIYKYKDVVIFKKLKKVELFAINKKFWVGFGLKHNLNYDETQRVINDMLRSYLGLTDYISTKGWGF